MIPWRQYYQTGVLALDLTPKDFWKLTFAEFWALYDGKFGHIIEPMTKDQFEEIERRWVNGNA